MSDHDLATDDLEARLVTALHRRAERTTPSAPSAERVRAGARRQDRRRRLQLGAVAAAAVIVAALVVLRPGTDDATYYVGPGPATDESTPEPLHLVIDDATVTLTDATEARPTGPTPPGTTSPGGLSTSEEIVYGAPGAIDSPVLIVGVRTTTGPAERLGPLAANQQPVQINERPARLMPQVDGPFILLPWDETRTISATAIGIDELAMISALATLDVDESGRWSVAAPPAGLEEVARTDDPDGGTERDWSSELRYLATPDQPSSGTSGPVRLVIVPIDADAAEADEELLVRALGSRSASGSIERTTVRGHPAYIVTAPRSESMERIVYLWVEPGRGLVTVWFDDDDRARADRLVAAVREPGPAEWATTIERCSHVLENGTVAVLPDGVSGGRCPGS